MKDKRILSNFLSKRQEIKIVVIYVFLLIGIVTTSYISVLFRDHQFAYQSAENTVLPIPNVEFLLWDSDKKSFELSFYRFHDIQNARTLLQLYVHLKLRPNIQSKKEIIIKSKISIMRSGWHRDYAGSILENERIEAKLTCLGSCKPQMIFEHKIAEDYVDYRVAIEILNPSDIYNEGVEALTTGIVTEDLGFAVRVLIIKIILYIISICAFILTVLSLDTIRDPLYLRIFTLCGVFVNSQGYLFYPGRIRILIREAILATHTALLVNLYISSIECIAGQKFKKWKLFLIILITAPSFIVYHLLWNLPIIIGASIFGGWSIWILYSNYQRTKKSSRNDKAFFLVVLAYIVCYLFILIKGDFNFLGSAEFSILFNLKNAIFSMIIILIQSFTQSEVLNTEMKSVSKERKIVDFLPMVQSNTEV